MKRARGTGRVFQPQYGKAGQLKTSRLWWIQFYCRHRCAKADCTGVHLEPSGSTKQSVAERLLRKRLGELDDGRWVGPEVEETTFADLEKLIEDDYRVNERRSTLRLKADLKHLREVFGSHRTIHITTDRIKAYTRQRLDAGAAPATVQNELTTLNRMFTLAVQSRKMVQKPYVPRLTLHNTRQGFFEEAEFRAVLAELPDPLKPLAEFAYYTGWRKSDMLRLTWKQVDFKAGEVRLEPMTTKNDEGRVFPFHVLPALRDLLTRQREATTALEKKSGQIIPWVFHRQGQPIKDYDTAWHSACKKAGVLPGRVPGGRTLHDFRRTVVRNLERAGVPRSVAMKLTGHKTERVYTRYAIVASNDLKEGVAKLAALHLAQQAESPAAPAHQVVELRGKR